MKKIIMSATLVLISFLFLGTSVLATDIGGLEDNLRISVGGTPCIRPIFIGSIGDQINVYVTGDIINSATILSNRILGSRETRNVIYLDGGMYFDFKDEKFRKRIIEALKKLVSTHEENKKLYQETGKSIPYAETADSYFFGSLAAGEFNWATVGHVGYKHETFDNFRFLTMRITVTVPMIGPVSKFKFDENGSDLDIDSRIFHSGNPLKIPICNNNKSFVGIVDPMSSTDLPTGYGYIFINFHRDKYILNDPNLPKDLLVFKGLIKNIVLQVLKTKETLPMRSF